MERILYKFLEYNYLVKDGIIFDRFNDSKTCMFRIISLIKKVFSLSEIEYEPVIRQYLIERECNFDDYWDNRYHPIYTYNFNFNIFWPQQDIFGVDPIRDNVDIIMFAQRFNF